MRILFFLIFTISGFCASLKGPWQLNNWTLGAGKYISLGQLSASTSNLNLWGTNKTGLSIGPTGYATQTTGLHIKTSKIKAVDGDGVYFVDDADNGIFVKDGGFVGIGTGTPSELFEVYATSSRLAVTTTGLVSVNGIAGVTAGVKLYVAGGGEFTGVIDAAGFTVVSSIDMKKETQGLKNATQMLLKLKPAEYKMKNGEDDFTEEQKSKYRSIVPRKYTTETGYFTDYSYLSGLRREKNRVGFIAENVCDAIPSACRKNKVNRYEIGPIIAVLAGAAREQQTIIESLLLRIKALEK